MFKWLDSLPNQQSGDFVPKKASGKTNICVNILIC